MTRYCSTFRTEQSLQQALAEVRALQEQYQTISIDNRGTRFNTDLLEALELEGLLGLAETTVFSALERRESRGAHYRTDYPERDDDNYLRHTLVQKTDAGPAMFIQAGHHNHLSPQGEDLLVRKDGSEFRVQGREIPSNRQEATGYGGKNREIF